MMAPEASKTFPLKSALLMDVSMVTALLLIESPLMVSLFNAPLVGDGGDGKHDITGCGGDSKHVSISIRGYSVQGKAKCP